jgi:hypothetical protein
VACACEIARVMTSLSKIKPCIREFCLTIPLKTAIMPPKGYSQNSAYPSELSPNTYPTRSVMRGMQMHFSNRSEYSTLRIFSVATSHVDDFREYNPRVLSCLSVIYHTPKCGHFDARVILLNASAFQQRNNHFVTTIGKEISPCLRNRGR